MSTSNPNFRRVIRGLAWGLLSLLVTTVASAVAVAGGLKSELVISTGLTLPVFGAAPSDDFDHLYIAEQKAARIRMLDLETKQLTTVLDLPNADPSTGQETGLNGFAFHPDYANNGKIYVQLSGNVPNDVRILEFTRSVNDPTVFDPNSQREVLTIPNPQHSHNGGWIGFGPNDGYLYIATGDGGNFGTAETKGLPAQDVNDIRGKILRIDVDNGDQFPDDVLRNYVIPPTNLYANGGGAPEVFASGLRHPYRNSFDRDTGDLYIADVGSRFFEEINFLPAGTNGGQNYGWRPLEGFVDNPDWPDPAPPNAIDPIHAYAHGTSAAVIGGYVYRGESIPWLQGTYFFGDFVQKTWFSMRYDGNEITEFTDRAQELASPLGSYGAISSYAEDASGELYMFDYFRGDVYKILARTAVELGDYNGNGIVDAADYTVWRDTLGNVVNEGTGADGSGNGTIDGDDYNIWKMFFGRSVDGSGSAALSATVPEPAAITLLVVGTLSIGCLRRRNS